MSTQPFAITSDTELERAARDKTSYDDSPDELPGSVSTSDSQMAGIVRDAKRVLYMNYDSDRWYDDLAYGQALVALTAMKMKEAVENINIDRYGIGDESLSFTDADPDDSQQIRSWSSEISEGIREATLDEIGDDDLPFSNTSSYIG